MAEAVAMLVNLKARRQKQKKGTKDTATNVVYISKNLKLSYMYSRYVGLNMGKDKIYITKKSIIIILYICS